MAGRRPRQSSLEETETVEGEELTARHGEFDGGGGGGCEDVWCCELPSGSRWRRKRRLHDELGLPAEERGED